MILEEIKKIKSNEKEWRKFGLTVGIAFGVFGALLAWRGKGIFPYFLALSAVLIVLGIIRPRILNRIHRVWMTIALLIGWVMSHVLLTLLFYLAVTPAGFIAKLSGKDLLDQKFRENKPSYWVSRQQRPFQQADYERQF